jgi:hypothetical protein
MKSFIRNLAMTGLALGVLLGTAISTKADLTVNVNPGNGWIGYMNVFDIPQNAALGPYPPDLGAYQFGSSWGTADLTAVFSGGYPLTLLTLGPNTIGDANEYWYIGGGAPGAVGNKIMDANMYVELGELPGQTLTFSGDVLANTLVGSVDPLGNGWTAVAFIKDFAADYSSFNVSTVPLAAGPFSVALLTDAGAGRHVQYGFEVIGPDVWYTDVAPYGSIQITAVPEPSSLALLGLGALGALVWRRRQ